MDEGKSRCEVLEAENARLRKFLGEVELVVNMMRREIPMLRQDIRNLQVQANRYLAFRHVGAFAPEFPLTPEQIDELADKAQAELQRRT